MAPEMLLYNIGLMEIQRKQAEEGRVVAEEMRRVTEEKHQRTEEALAEANRRLSRCVCGGIRCRDGLDNQLSVPIPHALRRASSAILQVKGYNGVQ
jgi:hypothetical protein